MLTPSQESILEQLKRWTPEQVEALGIKLHDYGKRKAFVDRMPLEIDGMLYRKIYPTFDLMQYRNCNDKSRDS